MVEEKINQTKKKYDYSCSLSLYPIGTENFVIIISDAIIKLQEMKGIDITVGKMNTIVKGNKEEVFKAIDIVTEEAAKKGNFVLNVTISNVVGLT